jgi:hypothetical protein
VHAGGLSGRDRASSPANMFDSELLRLLNLLVDVLNIR